MFTKNKVSQSMIDAVKGIINESGTPIKEPTSTGMRVYGRSYGNSAKAKQDQTAHELDKVKGPKEKEMKEAAKPDFLDMDKDGNKKEPMKKAISDKNVKEELKGNQDKIDANHNDKIDAQDFKILKAKKKVTEDMHFAKRLLEAQKLKQSPAKNQDVADKSYLKDKPGSVKSDLKNLGRFLTGKKETNEEVELDEADTIYVQHSNGAPQKVKLTPDMKAAGKIYVQHPSGPQTKVKLPKVKEEVELDEAKDKKTPNLPIDNKGIDKHYGGSVVKMGAAAKKAGFSDDRIRKTGLDYLNRKEEVELTEEQLDEMINEVLGKDASAGDYIHDFVHSDNPKFAGKSKAERKKMALGAYYGKQNEAIEEGKRPETDDAPPFDEPYTKTTGDVKDKSGAVHTPMSRARDLARAAMKKVKTEMLGKTGTSEGKKW